MNHYFDAADLMRRATRRFGGVTERACRLRATRRPPPLLITIHRAASFFLHYATRRAASQ